MAPIGPEPTETEKAAVEAWLDTPVVVPNRRERRERMKRQFRGPKADAFLHPNTSVVHQGDKGKQAKLS